MKSPRTYVHPDIQTERQTEIFFGLFFLLSHTNHEHLSKGENFFFFTHAITILSLFTYSVCDEKVKKNAVKATEMVGSVLEEGAVTHKTCNRWFQRFRNVNFDLCDRKRPVQP